LQGFNSALKIAERILKVTGKTACTKSDWENSVY